MSLRVALVGYGLAGRVIHRPLIEAVPELTLTHVVTADPGRAAEAARDAPSARVVPTVEELWQRADDHDVVVVATTNDAHVPIALTALELGKAVVVDKPLALTADAAQELVTAAAGRPLSVFHNRRWDSDTLTGVDLLAAGTLGTVHRLEARFTRFRPEVQRRWREQPGSGGVLLDLGTHLVDQAVHLLGPVASVYAEVRASRAGAVVDDDCLLALTHTGGASSLLWCSANAPWTGPRLVLQGSAAGWVKQDLDGQEDAQRRGLPVPPEPPGVLWDADGARAAPSRQGDWSAYYRALVAHLLSGGPLPVAASDGVAVLRVLEAAATSSAAHEVVVLPPAHH